MTRWLLRRTFDAAATAVVAIIVTIALVHILPGDPLAALFGERLPDPAQVSQLRALYGADRTLLQSVAAVFGGLAHGDLGISLSQQRPVIAVLAERIGPTVLLGSLTLLIDFTIGLALGVWSALHPDSIRARVLGALTLVGYTLPSFVIGMVLIWVFAVKLMWLPPGGLGDVLLSPDAPAGTLFLDHVRHLILPLAAMVIATIAVPLRQQRAAAASIAVQPWVLAARARGVSPALVAWRHCWRPALTPIVTLLGLWLPMLAGGAVFVEYVFDWPGVGLLLAHATTDRDVPLVIGAAILLIAVVQLGSLVADLLYHVVDPAQRAA